MSNEYKYFGVTCIHKNFPIIAECNLSPSAVKYYKRFLLGLRFFWKEHIR